MLSKEGYVKEIELEMRGYYESLSEKDARRYAAIESRKLGYGGVAYMSRVLGCSTESIDHGLSELSHLPNDPLGDRIRALGAGRKPTEVQNPEVLEQVKHVLASRTAGDPMCPEVTWTDMVPSQISNALQEETGTQVSAFVLRRLLKDLGFGRRQIQKSKTKKSVANRDLQFKNISRLLDEANQSGHAVFSIDTKKKEPLGQLYRDGISYSREPIKAWDHDFANWAEGMVVPHGIYDLRRNHGWINIGISRDTSEFATDSILQYWRKLGQVLYSGVKEILVVCDGGGSNGARTHIFKHDMQQVVNHIGIPIRVAHFPPYCSKYNPIERRLFSHVARACRGVLFDSLKTVVDLMKKTTTKAGLEVTVDVIEKIYETGRKVPKDFKKTTTIEFDERMPLWNFLVKPQETGLIN